MTLSAVHVLYNDKLSESGLAVKNIKYKFQNFRHFKKEDGSISVEFAVIFPIFILMLFFIISVSIYIATASEVQQIAFELARAAIGIVDGSQNELDICTTLATNVLPGLLDNAVFLDPAKLAPLVPCPDQPLENRSISITLSYSLNESALQELATSAGLNFGIIVRTAQVQL